MMTRAQWRKTMREAGGSRELLYCATVDGCPWIGNSYYAYTITHGQHAAQFLPDLEQRLYLLQARELTPTDNQVPNIPSVVKNARDTATQTVHHAEYHGRPITLDLPGGPPMLPFEFDDGRAAYLNARFAGLLIEELGMGDAHRVKVQGSDPMKVFVLEGPGGQGIIMPVRIA